MARALASLGGLPLNTNPDEIRWNFTMKTNEQRTMGGKVIQILGTTLSDISVRGKFSPLKSAGDTEAWENQVRFRKQVERWVERASTTDKYTPIRFTYSPRNWDFKVFVRSITPIEHSESNIAPTWEISLFPVDKGATTIISGAKDLYIARLVDGVGWKQSEYNGPTQSEVDATLANTSGSAIDYLKSQFADVAANGLPANKFSDLASDR